MNRLMWDELNKGKTVAEAQNGLNLCPSGSGFQLRQLLFCTPGLGYQSAFLNRPLVLLLFFLVSLTSYYSNLLFCCCSITGHFYRVVCIIPHINSTCFVLLSSLCHYYIGNCYIVMPPFFFFLLAYLCLFWLLLHCNIMVRFALRQDNL